MTPERWQQVKELLQSTLECEPGERAAFLDRMCAGDAELRREIESLLAFQTRAQDFIEEPAFGEVDELRIADALETMDGQRIGQYKVLRQIGQGGMGAVYLAVRADDQYQKQVAIKVVKRGMDSDDILRRFQNERQILASLDHPNIARLLDGGTTEDGRPYFVMEYIEGQPVDAYCDARKLTTEERLQLFRRIAAAVQYAHQNLVVHRDLKPGNILVTSDGTPKLLDFGIAKLLNPTLAGYQAIAPTQAAFRPMTPEYASPEQVRSEPITTASDVYALGVILYELLTGRRPYRVPSGVTEEVLRAICESEPEKPSTSIGRVEEIPGLLGGPPVTLTPERVSELREGRPEKLRQRLAGDLDNIVLMAMRKEPQRRYVSVEQFSEDIRRHLDGLPVIARKNTLRYRTRKFVQRHRGGVAAATLVVLALVAGIVTTSWQAGVARAQKARAERRFNDVRKLANSFMFELHDAIKNLPGSTPARQLLVKRALEYLDSLAQEATGDPALQRELAVAYMKLGDVQGNPYSSNLGDTAGALHSYNKVLSIFTALSAAEPKNLAAQRDLAAIYSTLAGLLWQTGDTGHVLEHYQKALSLYESVAAADPTNAKDRRDLARAYVMIGDTQWWIGDTTGAQENIRKGAAMYEALAAADPNDTSVRREVGFAYEKLGEAMAAADDFTGALENYRKTLAIAEPLAAGDPNNVAKQRSLWYTYNKIGEALSKTGDRNGSLESYRKALNSAEWMAAADPKNVGARRNVTISLNYVGDALNAVGDRGGALQHYRQSLAIREALLAGDPANAMARRDLTVCYERIGDLLKETGDMPGALENYRRMADIRASLVTSNPSSTEALYELASAHSYIGTAYVKWAKEKGMPAKKRKEGWEQARSHYQQGINILNDLRARGALKGTRTQLLDEMTLNLGVCDAALKGFGNK